MFGGTEKGPGFPGPVESAGFPSVPDQESCALPCPHLSHPLETERGQDRGAPDASVVCLLARDGHVVLEHAVDFQDLAPERMLGQTAGADALVVLELVAAVRTFLAERFGEVFAVGELSVGESLHALGYAASGRIYDLSSSSVKSPYLQRRGLIVFVTVTCGDRPPVVLRMWPSGGPTMATPVIITGQSCRRFFFCQPCPKFARGRTRVIGQLIDERGLHVFSYSDKTGIYDPR